MFSRLSGGGELLSQSLASLSSPFPLGNVLSTSKVPRDACGGHSEGRPLLFHRAVGWFVGDAKVWVIVLVGSHYLTSSHQLSNNTQMGDLTVMGTDVPRESSCAKINVSGELCCLLKALGENMFSCLLFCC